MERITEGEKECGCGRDGIVGPKADSERNAKVQFGNNPVKKRTAWKTGSAAFHRCEGLIKNESN